METFLRVPLGLLNLFIGVDALLQQGGHQGDVALHAGIAHGRPASTVIVEGVLEPILIPHPMSCRSYEQNPTRKIIPARDPKQCV